MPSAPNNNPEITFIQSVHQSIRMGCRRTSWKHVEPNIITYYCFDEHHKYSTIITQYAEMLLLSHNMLKYYYYHTICSNTTISIAQHDKSTKIDAGARGSARGGQPHVRVRSQAESRSNALVLSSMDWMIVKSQSYMHCCENGVIDKESPRTSVTYVLHKKSSVWGVILREMRPCVFLIYQKCCYICAQRL